MAMTQSIPVYELTRLSTGHGLDFPVSGNKLAEARHGGKVFPILEAVDIASLQEDTE